LSPHRAFQGHAAHTARWPAMLSPNGSSATCIADGVFHIPMPCFHGALPVYPQVLRHSSMTLSRRTDGMPEPAGVAFVPDKRPHPTHLRPCFTCALHVPGHLGGIQRAQQSGMQRLKRRFFLLEFTQHGVGTDMERARRITDPT